LLGLPAGSSPAAGYVDLQQRRHLVEHLGGKALPQLVLLLGDTLAFDKGGDFDSQLAVEKLL
jgi:hypothetical protein